MNVASLSRPPSRELCIKGSKRLLSELRGRVLRIKELRRQGVSAVCFDSPPYLRAALESCTFYPPPGSEPPPLFCLGLPLPSAPATLNPIPAPLWPPLSSALDLLELPSTKPCCQSPPLRRQPVRQVLALRLAERFSHSTYLGCCGPIAIVWSLWVGSYRSELWVGCSRPDAVGRTLWIGRCSSVAVEWSL